MKVNKIESFKLVILPSVQDSGLHDIQQVAETATEKIRQLEETIHSFQTVGFLDNYGDNQIMLVMTMTRCVMGGLFLQAIAVGNPQEMIDYIYDAGGITTFKL